MRRRAFSPQPAVTCRSALILLSPAARHLATSGCTLRLQPSTMGHSAANTTAENASVRLFCTLILAVLVEPRNNDFFLLVTSAKEKESPIAQQVSRIFWFTPKHSDSSLNSNLLNFSKALEEKLKISLLYSQLRSSEGISSPPSQFGSPIDFMQPFVSQKQSKWKATFLLPKLISLGIPQSVLVDTGLKSTLHLPERRTEIYEAYSDDPNAIHDNCMKTELILPNNKLSLSRKTRDVGQDFSFESPITDASFEGFVHDSSQPQPGSRRKDLLQPYYVPIPLILPISHTSSMLTTATNFQYRIYFTGEYQRQYGTYFDVNPILRPIGTKLVYENPRIEHQVQNPIPLFQVFKGYSFQIRESTREIKKTSNNTSFGPHGSISVEKNTRHHVPQSEKACMQYQQLYEKYSENDSDLGIANRVGKGEQGSIEEFPYMVAIGYVADNVGVVTWHCAGSVITENFVLTAAHCVSDASHQTDTHRELVVRAGTTFVGPSPERIGDRRVEGVCLHPQWSHWGKGAYHDLALLRLHRPLEFTSAIRPVCLPRAAASDPFLADIALVSGGWADRENADSLNKSLEVIHVDLLAEKDCITQLTDTESLPVGLGESILCVQGKSESSYFCRGDSGGPLVARAAAADVDVLIGVLTKSDSTCAGGGNALFSSTRDALPWIESIVWG